MRWYFFACCAAVALSLQASAASGVFPDVPSTHPYARAIQSLGSGGILHGYADGMFRPERTLNRAEMLTAILASRFSKDEIAACAMRRPFGDVAAADWYAPAVCFAKRKGIAKGNADGFFHPNDKVTMAEAAVLLARAWEVPSTGSGAWYEPAVRALVGRSIVPVSIASTRSHVTRGELAEMLWRLRGGKGADAATATQLLGTSCLWFPDTPPPHVDIEEVRHTWFLWVNGLRAGHDLPAYLPDRQLDRTASLWAAQAAAKGSISHKRPGQTAYYDYGLMEKWFAGYGLTYALEGQSAFTENIGWGVYTCRAADCTQALTDAVRTTFDFYVSERAANGSHWRSLVNEHFQHMGLGVATDGAGKYFLVVHYATALTSSPEPICP